jgi:acyl-CoA synthetase (AMP-forming)/AMP-acid ligase II
MKLVPTMLYRLLESPLLGTADISALQQVIYGGSHISISTLHRAISVFGSRLKQHYGQSEAPSILTVLPGRDHSAENLGRPMLASAGRPIAAVEIKISGPSGKVLGANEIGEIAVRAPHMMSRYWRRPDLTASVLRDGWLYTNDLGKIDVDGYVYLLGRKDELIISGGFNIAPKEVEDAICLHPAVREAAVVGGVDEKWGQIVIAYVSLRDPAVSTSQLIDFVKPLLGFKSPKIVKIIPELPKNPNGKIDKRLIAQLN